MIKSKPLIFNAEKFLLNEIKKKFKIFKIIDFYKDQLEDLFLVRNPQYKFNKNYQEDFERFIRIHSKGLPLEKCGNWVYFPRNGLLVHYLENKLHQEVRLARNRNLITQKEQEKVYNTKIGIAGLSVGSNSALALALMGVGKVFKLADPDVLMPSNLNRLIFDFTYIGVNKVEAVSRFIYQLNPYIKIQTFKNGISLKNINSFLDGIDILIEELDDIELKVKIREECKKRRIPVVMATDNGDGVIMDIERFDLEPNRPIFHGNLKNFDLSLIKKDPIKLYQVMAKIIDLNLVPLRVLKSVEEVGKTIYSWPQIITAAMMSGAIIAYVVRKILLGEKIKSGKYVINPDAIFDANFKKNEIIRKKELEKFKKFIGLS